MEFFNLKSKLGKLRESQINNMSFRLNVSTKTAFKIEAICCCNHKTEVTSQVETEHTFQMSNLLCDYSKF